MPKGNNLDMRLKRGHIQLILRKKKKEMVMQFLLPTKYSR